MTLLIEPVALPAPSRREVARRLATAMRSAARRARPVARERTRAAAARAVRLTFEDLAGTFSKFGQLVGSSPGLFGEDVAAEFRGFLDAGPPVPFPAVRRTIESELGRPLEEAFATFEPTPLAAASLAVVHRATLPDGLPVAVKVLRPGVEARIATDLAVMRPLFRVIGREVAIGIAGALPGLVSGFELQVAEELDLRNEARAQQWFARVLRSLNVTSIRVPTPVLSHSTRRVLTMDRFEGVAVDDVEGAAAHGLQPGDLLHECLNVWFAATLCTGAFHGDIHAGNVLLLPDGTLALLDWGIVGRFDAETARFFRRMIEAVLGDDSAWPDVAGHVASVYGDGLADALGITGDQWVAFVRNQVEPIFALPFGEVDLRAMLIGNSGADGTPAAPPKTKREFFDFWREERRRQRLLMESQGYGGGFDQATFLLSKQLVYFERYGKLFMPESPLLHDRDAFRALLDLPILEDAVA